MKIPPPYPKWLTDALDRIAAKPDNEPLTNTESEALAIYHYGSLDSDR